MKLNYFGLAAGILAIASLLLPWFTVNMTASFEEITMDFTAYLYQVQGTVNSISATVFPNVWFVLGALGLVIITVIFSFAGGLLIGRKGQILLLAAGITALLSMVMFGGGLLMSDYASTDLEPAAVMNLFQPNAFGITADAAMEKSYDFVWWLSFGFWLTIVAGILAFVAAVAPSLSKKNVAT